MTDAISPEEVAAIARGLTKAQREIMSSMKQDSARHGPYHLYQRRNRSLWSVLRMAKLGLIARGDEPDTYDFYEPTSRSTSNRHGLAVLTPLGLALRDHLLAKGAQT